MDESRHNRRITRNIAWNFVGTSMPLVLALVTIPQLIAVLGTARFGVLTLVWMVVGYFSVFDMGLGRSLTKLVAERIDSDKQNEIPFLVWAALGMMIALGILGTIIVALLSPWFVTSVLNIPSELTTETAAAFLFLSLSIPIVISSNALRGILEAYQEFGLVNIVRIPLGAITFLGPLAVSFYTNSLAVIAVVLVLARLASWTTYLLLCLVKYPLIRQFGSYRRDLFVSLLSFGGWMTVSNLVGPLLLYLGRFFIAAMISAEAVAYFVTPYEVVSKLLIIPAVLVSVLFPEISRLGRDNSPRIRQLYQTSMRGLGLVMAVLCVLVFLLAETGLTLWIDAGFAVNSYRVAQILAVGVFINAFGHVAQVVLQGSGRPDITAKVHIAELIAYIPYLSYLISTYGIEGAAYAWSIRVLISTCVLMLLANKCLSGTLATR
ncbi:MAG: flippase [Gammaproteobacteria bacterium]|nr:flippase [Gammaproteobacteria bacterium]